jgi:hypothetical protein
MSLPCGIKGQLDYRKFPARRNPKSNVRKNGAGLGDIIRTNKDGGRRIHPVFGHILRGGIA